MSDRLASGLLNGRGGRYGRCMTNDVEEASAYVRSVVKALGFGEGGTPLPLALIDRAMGRDAIHELPRLPSLRREGAIFFRVGGRWRVAVRRELPDAQAHWSLALVFARYCLAQDGVGIDEARRLRALVASAIILPADTMRPVFRERDPIGVSRALVVPVAATLLRRGELAGVPTLAVVKGRYARVRGDEARVMPRDQATAEAWAFGPRVIRTKRWIIPGESERIVERAA